MEKYLNENNIIKENIKDFRILLMEGMGQNDIVDAIKNRKVMYIYYAGDKTVLKGYRTIECYLIGKTTAGNMCVRAYQQAGVSDSNKGVSRPIRPDKDLLPGWRLFNIEFITSMLPTGKHFATSPNKIRPKYNPNDKQMSEIIFAIQPSDTDIKFIGKNSIIEPDATIQKVDTGDKDQLGKEAQKKQELTKEKIIDLYDLVRRHYKKATKDFIVVNKNNEFMLDYERNRNKYNPNNIMGNLYQLFNQYTGQEGFKLSNKWIDQQRKEFADKMKKI